MKSKTALQSDYGVDTKNSSTANLAQGLIWMNDYHRRLLAKADWPFLHRLRTAVTIASTTFVPLPYDVDQVESVFVTVGSTRHNPKPAPSRAFWDKLHYSVQTSDTPQWWFVYNGELGLWPRPATAGSVISMNAKIRVIDLSIADITGTTITSITNGASALVVSAGLTVQMVGFWIRPTFVTTAKGGDGVWYEISAVSSATEATLVRKYGGLSIVDGTAVCTISQMSLLPEAFDNLPELYAAYRYWHKEKDERAADFFAMCKDGTDELFRAYGFSDLSMVVDDGEPRGLINPNLTISL